MASRTRRIEERLERSIDNGKFYEASQMVKTLCFRYKLQAKFDEAIDLLHWTALIFLKRKQTKRSMFAIILPTVRCKPEVFQYETGMDIGRLLITMLKDSHKPISAEYLEKVIDVLNLCDEDSTSRQDFIREALVWSSGRNVYGNSQIHLAAARKYWGERNYSQAREHFIYTSEGTQCASFLIEYHVTCGFPSEVDMFVTQAVLQFLCLRNNPTASVVFFAYTARHPGIRRKQQPYRYPLLNFVAFLLLAIECGSLQQFSVLCEQYQPSLRRDPTYLQYLDKIGQEFFGLPPKKKEKTGLIGILGDLFENMLTQSDEDGMRDGTRDGMGASVRTEDVE